MIQCYTEKVSKEQLLLLSSPIKPPDDLTDSSADPFQGPDPQVGNLWTEPASLQNELLSYMKYFLLMILVVLSAVTEYFYTFESKRFLLKRIRNTLQR